MRSQRPRRVVNSCPLCGGRWPHLTALPWRKCLDCGFQLADADTLPAVDSFTEAELIAFARDHGARLDYLAEYGTIDVRRILTNL
jgi:hypothetical protein